MSFIQTRGSKNPDERTALLPRNINGEGYIESDENDGSRQSRDLEPWNLNVPPNTVNHDSTPLVTTTRWPSISSIILLGLLMTTIMLSAFIVPAALQTYAKEAIIVEPIKVSVESITKTGLNCRVQANVKVEAERVQNRHTRNIGIICSWLFVEVGTREAGVQLYLTGYNDLPFGNVVIPGLAMDVRNGHSKLLDFSTNLSVGNPQGLEHVAVDWIKGKIDKIQIVAKTEISFRSGILSFGSRSISQTIFIKGPNIPVIDNNATSLSLYETPIPGYITHGLTARMLTSFKNNYNIEVEIPKLEVEVLVPGCNTKDYVRLLYAETHPIHVNPQSQIKVRVDGTVKELPESLMELCPNSTSTPLDALMWNYINGYGITVFIRGSKRPNKEAPYWLFKFLSSITEPVGFPSRNMSDALSNFSIRDMEFRLPDMITNPGFGKNVPHISGIVKVDINIPKEINFVLNITKVRATGKVFFENRKFGEINVRNWQDASSVQVNKPNKRGSTLNVQSQIKNAPIQITDDAVFNDVIHALLSHRPDISLQIIALVDIYVLTVLGEVTLTNLPAEGFVPLEL